MRLGSISGVLLAIAALAIIPSSVSHAAVASSRTPKGAHYKSSGVIKSFAPDQSFASIAHEDIAGYMTAMTMNFEPGTKDLFHGLSVGDAVTFEFTDFGDGRHIVNSIAKK